MIRGIFLIVQGTLQVIRSALVNLLSIPFLIFRLTKRAGSFLVLLTLFATFFGALLFVLSRIPAVRTRIGKFLEMESTKKLVLCFLGGPLVFTAATVLCCTSLQRPETSGPDSQPAVSHRVIALESDLPPTLIFWDQLPKDSFHIAVKRQTKSWQNFSPRRRKKAVARFGGRKITVEDLQKSLLALDQLITEIDSPRLLDQLIRENFEVYQMAGKTGTGSVLMTGYFHPLIRGSLQKTAQYRYPLYRRPKDLIYIDLGRFKKEYKGKRIIGRLSDNSVIPYYNRRQIDQEMKLQFSGLELAYVASNLDRFFLQIQGSGSLVLPNSKIFPVNYDGQNGRRYVSIGSKLIQNGLLSKDEVSMQSIRKLLKYDPNLANEYMNTNPSYVFFKKGKGGPRGSRGAVITPWRTIATDKKYFPSGVPAFVQFQRPSFNEKGEIVDWHPTSGFMIDQDTGGAIKGPGRADLYLGMGSLAEMIAGHLAHHGKIYFLVLKPKITRIRISAKNPAS